MNFNELSKLVQRKYGLKFKPAVKGSTNLYLLVSPISDNYFAMMSRFKIGNHLISTLDLNCGDLAAIVQGLPGFSTPYRLKSPNWVGISLKAIDQATLERVFEYAFKLALNQTTKVNEVPYLLVSDEQDNHQYQEQAIPRPRTQQAKRSLLPKVLQKMQASYDYSVLPAKGREKNFYRQGKIVADFVDNYDKSASFKRYYPTYHDMTPAQLRTYFTWRGKVRQHQYQKISRSYCYIYLYELINGIGVVDPKAGLVQMVAFLHGYVQKFDIEIEPYLLRWIKDYCVYYHLDSDCQEIFSQEIKSDQKLKILSQPANFSASQLLTVLEEKVPYLNKKIASKKLEKKFAPIIKQIWEALSNNQSFFHKYVANQKTSKCSLFANAVFYEHGQSSKQSLVVDQLREYRFINQEWQLCQWLPVKGQTQKLNNIFHEIDRLLRKNYRLGSPLKARKVEDEYLQLIQAAIFAFQKQSQLRKQKKIKVDLTKLGKIRTDASITRESLLTDEEKQLEEKQVSVEKETSEFTLASANSSLNLTADQMFFLNALLNHQDWKAYLNKRHLMASILADQINNQLFDQLGDMAIEFNDQNEPQIISDYQEEIYKLLKRSN